MVEDKGNINVEEVKVEKKERKILTWKNFFITIGAIIVGLLAGLAVTKMGASDDAGGSVE